MKLTNKYIKQLIKEEMQREGFLDHVKSLFNKKERLSPDEALGALVSAYDTEMGTNRWKPREAVQQLVARDDIKGLLKTIFPDGVREFGQALTSGDNEEILRVIKQHKRIQKKRK